jgi:hypothetical protein
MGQKEKSPFDFSALKKSEPGLFRSEQWQGENRFSNFYKRYTLHLHGI